MEVVGSGDPLIRMSFTSIGFEEMEYLGLYINDSS